jgi:hypothetical protein
MPKPRPKAIPSLKGGVFAHDQSASIATVNVDGGVLSWLDVSAIARVEVTSEDSQYPIESAFAEGDKRGRRAAERTLNSSPRGQRDECLEFQEYVARSYELQNKIAARVGMRQPTYFGFVGRRTLSDGQIIWRGSDHFWLPRRSGRLRATESDR